MKTVKKHSNKKGKRRFSWKLFAAFIVFEFIFTAITGPFMLYYGPFKNARDTMVGAAMTTMTHQWIATTFLSNERIQEILNKNRVQDISQDGLENDEIKINNRHDNTIERYDIDGNTYKGYLLVIHDPRRVKVGHSSKLPRVGETTSKIAKNYKAVAAVNAGGFTDESANGQQWAGNGGQPQGIIMSNGNTIYDEYKSETEFKKHDIVAMTKEGILLVGKHTLKEVKEKNVTDMISFGPALIVNGKKTIKNGDGGWGKAPRTAIGQTKDGSILLLVLDGKQVKRLAATLRDVQDVLYEYGAVNASNLDGGSSTTMYYEGKVINEPSNALGERSIPSVVYVEP
ncbi:exopolysaccharide biosynthesis protein [Clostridium novyi A str. 4552]|uniref:Exopolysaccharide biosynthesis protein n=1 Tax=Clostridium novyi A str. 4552 TaxID=1444289 RepID=A0A0A0I540_CLONO|nr:phosphodiester glycosidase family protein [Clostridium novyi]KGM94765.1 exopolysaccharide biosynthesis protein [Clostridium novyi A str. 4552]